MIEPDLDAFDAMARAAYKRLPAEFRALCGNVIVHVAEAAAPEVLEEFGIGDALELTGLFEGVEFAAAEDAPPNHVLLYRWAILAEWRDCEGIDLDELILHVLVHEIGHHFGLSDEDMHAIEEAAD